jgi:hypothetical protein
MQLRPARSGLVVTQHLPSQDVADVQIDRPLEVRLFVSRGRGLECDDVDRAVFG